MSTDEMSERLRTAFDRVTVAPPSDDDLVSIRARHRSRRLRRRIGTGSTAALIAVAIVGIAVQRDTPANDVVASDAPTATSAPATYGFPAFTPLFNDAPPVVGTTTVIETPDVVVTFETSPQKWSETLTAKGTLGSGSASADPMLSPAIVEMGTGEPDDPDPTRPRFISGVTRSEVARIDWQSAGGVVSVETVANSAFAGLRFFLIEDPGDSVWALPMLLSAYDARGRLLTDTRRIWEEQSEFMTRMLERAGRPPAGGGPGASVADVNVGRTLHRFATDTAQEAFDAIPFVEGPVRLLYQGEPTDAHMAAELRDPSVWNVAYREPDPSNGELWVSALVALQELGEDHLSFAPGPYAYCARSPEPTDFDYDEHVIIEPAAIDSCADWFGVDIYLVGGRIIGVNLEHSEDG